MAIITACVNHKGGVGKSTTTFNLGACLAAQGERVLLIDLDSQANLSEMAGVGAIDPLKTMWGVFSHQQEIPCISVADNLYIAPSSLELCQAERAMIIDTRKGILRLRLALKDIQSDFDHIIIDCPPSLQVLTENALVAADQVIIVLQAQFLASRGMQDIIDLQQDIQEHHNPQSQIAGILITQVERTTLSNQLIDVMRENYHSLVYNNVIRKNVAIAEASAESQSIIGYAPRSNGAIDYRSFSQEFLEKITQPT